MSPIVFSIYIYIYIRTTNVPSTPESARRQARAATRLQQLQMTDPDDRRSRSRSRSVTPPVAIPQPIFLPQQIPADLDVPGPHSMAGLNLQPPMRRVSAVSESVNSISLNDDPEEDPFGFHDEPRHNLAPQGLAGVNIVIPPEVQLPANWDAPLQNPMPTGIVPPMPIPLRRGRGRPPLGPMHDISGGRGDPALNGLHCGHIALREQTANYRDRARIQALQQQQQERLAEQIQIERELADLRRHAEQRREAETARQQEAQQAHPAAAEIQQPLPVIPPVQHIDLQAAMDAARQRDERWMQQMHNAQRNEQQAQQQLQQDEENGSKAV